MNTTGFVATAIGFVLSSIANPVQARRSESYPVGNPLGLISYGDFQPISSNVNVFGVSRIRPGESAELIAENIPSAASICYGAGANQLVVSITSQSTLGFIPLD